VAVTAREKFGRAAHLAAAMGGASAQSSENRAATERHELATRLVNERLNSMKFPPEFSFHANLCLLFYLSSSALLAFYP